MKACVYMHYIELRPIQNTQAMNSLWYYIFVCVCVTWFAIRDHLYQNICDMIYEKGWLLNTSKKQNSFMYIHAVTMNSCAHIAIVCITNCFWDVVILPKSLHKCFTTLIANQITHTHILWQQQSCSMLWQILFHYFIISQCLHLIE